MQKLQSYQFVELSPNELVNITGGHRADFDVLCNLVPSLPNLELTLGGKAFEMTPYDYVLKVVEEGVSVCISGFDINVPSPLGPLFKL